MSIEAGVSSSTSKGLIVFEGDMSPCFWVLVPLSKAKIDDIDNMLLLTSPNEEVIRLDISMEESILMNILYALQLHP